MGVSSEPLSKERIFVPLTDKENRISLSVIPPVSRYSYFLAENASLLYIHILQKPFTMSGRQAKTLSSADLSDLLVFASCTRNPLRNRVIVLLSTKAGMRAGEIANLTWDMVLGPAGQIGGIIELRDNAAKKGSGRVIPMHSELRAALADLHRAAAYSEYVVRARGGHDPAQHRRLVQPGVQEHRPARLLIPFGPKNVCHARGAVGAQSWRLAARCSTVGRASVDPDDAAVHRW